MSIASFWLLVQVATSGASAMTPVCVGPQVQDQQVLVSMAAKVDPDGRLESSLRELFARLSLGLCVRRQTTVARSVALLQREPASALLGQIWITDTATGASVFASTRTRERMFTREITFVSLDEVALEEIAHVVFTVAEAFRDGVTVGEPLTPTQTVDDSAPATASAVLPKVDVATIDPQRGAGDVTLTSTQGHAVTSSAWDVTFLGRMCMRGALIQTGFGGRLTHALDRSNAPWKVWLGGGWSTGGASVGNQLEVSTRGFSAEVGLGKRVPLSTNWRVTPEVAMVLDRLTTQASAPANGPLTIADPSTKLWVLWRAGAGLQRALGAHAMVTLLPFVELDLEGRYFAVVTPRGQDAVVRPWKVGIGTWLGIGAGF